MRIALLTCLPDNFLVCWLLLHLSRFLSGISRKDIWYYVAYVYNGELISLIGNQRVGIFPPKSEIVFVLSLALIWCRNFQDRTIPVGGDTWPCFWRKERRRRIIIRIKKHRVQGSCPRSNISEMVRDIRVPFSLLGRCKSHATKRCNPRLCSCYRFWDIVVANINNFPILLDFTRANTYMASNEFARHNNREEE